MVFFSRSVYLVHIVAEPPLEYHPFPSPERYSKEQRGTNFKQKGHLNIQTKENNGSINYTPRRRGSRGNLEAGKLFLCDLFPSPGARRAESWLGTEKEREDGGMGERERSGKVGPRHAKSSRRSEATGFGTWKRGSGAGSCLAGARNQQQRQGRVPWLRGKGDWF